MTQRAIDGSYIYFVTTNTTYRRWIFDPPGQAQKLGQMIRTVASERYFDLPAYCILPNHIHLLVRKRGIFTLSKFMNDLKGRYSFQQRQGRLWQPRFNFRIVYDDNRFTRTIEYIKYNYRKMNLDEHFGQPPYVFIDWERIRTLI